MTAVLPLAVWPYPVPPAVMDALRVAKESLAARDGLDFKVQVSPAVPGSPTRVLSFNGPTPFFADVAMLRNWQDPAELAYWLEWTLDESKPVHDGFSKAKWIAMHFPGAREVEDDTPNPRTLEEGVYDHLPF